MNMLIDTHAHVNFNAFRDDADEVIRRSLSENIWMILVGSEYKTSKRGLEYANKYQAGVYSAVGLHPSHLDVQEVEADQFGFSTISEEYSQDLYDKLGQFEKVVAIGEIGLDYNRMDPSKDISAIKKKQKDVFVSQLELSLKLKKPCIIHCRQAHDDMLEILKEFRKEYKQYMSKDYSWAVMHCFSGDENLAWEYFNLGLMISFTGLITFSSQWDDLIRKMPLDKFMIETDCPYLTPEPYRGQRNEPSYVKFVAQRISEIKKMNVEKISDISTANARQFFKI